MSAHPKTSDDEILSAARQLLEDGGIGAVSMQAVAAAVGIKAPSLYKRFESRNHLLRSVSAQALGELRGAVEGVSSRSRRKALWQMAEAYRAFAHRSPRMYDLLYSGRLAPDIDAGAPPRQAAAAKLLEILTEQLGAAHALPAARLLVAYLHGFVSMELAGAFRLGGSVNQAFEFGLKTILDALFAPG